MNTTIITFVDYKYLDIYNIFYDNFSKLNLDLLVISLDEKSFNDLNSRNIKTIYKPYAINLKDDFWKFRLNVINDIFKETKRNIIHTDSDCFWFKNILDKINEIKGDYDIIGSIAFGWPMDIVNKIGFILCCGFYFIKYTDKNSNILDRIISSNITCKDDQILFNTYIYNNKKNIESIDTSILCKIINLKDDIKIGIIKDNIISRKYNKGLYCFHPLLKSNIISEKILEIKSYF